MTEGRRQKAEGRKGDSPIHRFTHSPFFIALWFAMLFLPFKGIEGAFVLFVVLLTTVFILRFLAGYIRPLKKRLQDAGTLIIQNAKCKMQNIGAKSLIFLLILLLCLPFFAKDYFIDIAILSGIYIILAQGLNIVVGLAGLLNLGFVAFYAIGAYSYALLNTKLGLGFWTALPASVLFSTVLGFVLAFPALRLRGDYLAIVTLGFGEIVRLVLNNWDSLTKGPNGIGGIQRPYLSDIPLGKLSYYYYFILLFVILTIFVVRRVYSSRIGRAWVAIREDEIASSSIGIDTTAYKLYSFAFGAFWAGVAGTLFAAKMQFVSPESFTFMESVLILCMVILGGLGSIPGVIFGSVILVMLPEMLREIQLYRMLALGSGLVLLMIFRPQGLLGRR
ncbi:MAG: branched-chain amino acid ABC transporter permease [Nitrospirae bacterium]|nr:branched-chain amino acid ABC transporter permease [Nitrospirota bacterium]